MLGIKTIETRHWQTDYRGDLAVHAAKRLARDEADWWAALARDDPRFPAVPTLGAIVGVVNLTDCVPTESLISRLSDDEESWGNYGPGRYGWLADRHRPLATPIPYPGRQSFFSFPDELLPPIFRA